MKKVLVPFADGFEEIETVTVIDILRRGGVNVVAAGLTGFSVKGARRIGLQADAVLENVLKDDFDMIVLPGGQPGVDHLRQDKRLLTLLKQMHEQKKGIAAICAAPLILRDAGIADGIRFTCYPSVEKEIPGGRFEDSRIVVYDHFVTSRSPGTAMEFALKIVEILMGKDRALEISEMLLART